MAKLVQNAGEARMENIFSLGSVKDLPSLEEVSLSSFPNNLTGMTEGASRIASLRRTWLGGQDRLRAIRGFIDEKIKPLRLISLRYFGDRMWRKTCLTGA
ncbi:Hypothetical protein NTJ_01841 [Nesidiocoris tenuis]|uniref:Uncharacterized protein n=1 Tax=Nesidiocoris tenuis TaxID=355587 RepID=A0ABN7A9Q1_9HEMI|nr:Hypothetical protein NTJ_01841 [Nesidiocoris tenuis]